MSRSNFSSELARSILSNTVLLNNFIDNILKLLEKCNLQGINLDFENLYAADRNLFTQFIRMLSQSLQKKIKF